MDSVQDVKFCVDKMFVFFWRDMRSLVISVFYSFNKIFGRSDYYCINNLWWRSRRLLFPNSIFLLPSELVLNSRMRFLFNSLLLTFYTKLWTEFMYQLQIWKSTYHKHSPFKTLFHGDIL